MIQFDSMITPHAHKNLHNLTKLEKEKELSKLAHQQEELIDEMGQSSDKKALSTVQKYVKEQEELENVQREIDFAKLAELSRNKMVYQRYLVTILYRFIKEESIPKKYSLFAESSEEGVIVGIENTPYVGAFKTCGIPMYDINACKILAVRLGNTIARMEGHFSGTDAGILLPEKGDLEIALRYPKRKYARRS